MQCLTEINQADPSLWNSKLYKDYPFIRKEFLSALENTQAIGVDSGWHTHYLVNSPENQEGHFLLPAFVKEHSYGEYVFDWSWADAYHRHGLNYYPKLIIAAPFTPATGPRLIGEHESIWQTLTPKIEAHCISHNLSSSHILFPNHAEQKVLRKTSWLERTGVQFHWYNKGYQGFEDFLSTFKSRKRKSVKKERNSIHQQGIIIEQLSGQDILPSDWDFFFQCYQTTYLKRGMQGYLNLATFKTLAIAIPEQLLLFVAKDKSGVPLACALYFIDNNTLYGRYWGERISVPNLHFEMCYYQGIEFCIKNNLKRFDPGTQGEHKISRGFQPTLTYSYHWLAQPEFHQAVDNFLKMERKDILSYKSACEGHLPFSHL